MYAVIETGGKQYRVELGSEIEVERLDVEAGETIDLPRVLLVADGDEAAVGRPLVDGARVSASVLRQDRGEKLVVFKYKPKARRRVKQGHRQELTILRVADIEFGGRSAAKEHEKVAAEQRKADEAARKAAAEQAAADQALAAKLAKDKAAAEAPKAKSTSATKSKSTATAKSTATSKSTTSKASDAKPKSAKTTASRTQAGESATKKTPSTRSRTTKKDE